MYHPTSLVKEIHDDRLRDLGLLPQRQLVRFPAYARYPGWRRLLQVGIQFFALIIFRR
jgi:hypothetical protein